MKAFSLSMSFLYMLAFFAALLALFKKFPFMPPSIPLAFSFLIISAIYMKSEMANLMVGALLSSSLSTIYLLSTGAKILEEMLENEVHVSIWDANPIAILLSIFSIIGLWYYHTGEVKNG